MNRILDRYLAASILTSTLLVLGVLMALFSFIQFVDALGDIGRAHYQMGDAVRYVLLSLPRQTHEVFPMAALLGSQKNERGFLTSPVTQNYTYV